MNFPSFCTKLLTSNQCDQALLSRLKTANDRGFTEGSDLVSDIGLDSMLVNELWMFCEEMFLIELSDDDVMSIRTLGELHKKVIMKLSVVTV